MLVDDFQMRFLFQNGGYTLDKEKAGQAMCPYDPHHNSTAVYVGKLRQNYT